MDDFGDFSSAFPSSNSSNSVPEEQNDGIKTQNIPSKVDFFASFPTNPSVMNADSGSTTADDGFPVGFSFDAFKGDLSEQADPTGDGDASGFANFVQFDMNNVNMADLDIPLPGSPIGDDVHFAGGIPFDIPPLPDDLSFSEGEVGDDMPMATHTLSSSQPFGRLVVGEDTSMNASTLGYGVPPINASTAAVSSSTHMSSTANEETNSRTSALEAVAIEDNFGDFESSGINVEMSNRAAQVTISDLNSNSTSEPSNGTLTDLSSFNAFTTTVTTEDLSAASTTVTNSTAVVNPTSEFATFEGGPQMISGEQESTSFESASQSTKIAAMNGSPNFFTSNKEDIVPVSSSSLQRNDDFGDFSKAMSSSSSNLKPTSGDGEFGRFANEETAATGNGEFGGFTTVAPDTSKNAGEFGAFSTGNSDHKSDGEFGTFPTSTAEGSHEFGDFSTSTAESSDKFGEFGSFANNRTELNNQAGEFSAATTDTLEVGALTNEDTSKERRDNDFGNFSNGNLNGNDNEFGTFSTGSTDIKKNDEFGNFSTFASGSTADTKEGFGAFASKNSGDTKEDFGEFGTFSSDDFGAFGNFSNSGTSGKFGDFSSASSQQTKPRAFETKSTGAVLLTCFKESAHAQQQDSSRNAVPAALKDTLLRVVQLSNANKDETTRNSSSQLQSVWTSIQKCIDFTVPLYKFDQSCLKGLYFLALKIDPMLASRPGVLPILTGMTKFEAPLGGTTAAEDLRESFGFAGDLMEPGSPIGGPESIIGGTSTSHFRHGSDDKTPALLDLSLPATPNSPTKDSFTLTADLAGLDLNPQQQSQQLTSIEELLLNERLVVNKSTWVDAKLADLGSGRGGNSGASAETTTPSRPHFPPRQLAKKQSSVEFQLLQLGLDVSKTTLPSSETGGELSLSARSVLGRLPDLTFMLSRDELVQNVYYSTGT